MSIAFHNDPALAEMVRAQVDAHTAADEIVQGRYWENGKGCFIGCLAHSSDTDKVEALTGFPLMLTRIAEGIFEGLDNAAAKGFPQSVIAAPPVGADLSLVPWQFLHWCVTDALRHADNATRTACAPALQVLADKAQGVPVTTDAADAADAAACAAYAADAACAVARKRQADKLIEMLAAAPVKGA
jgi:hypothetical protein